MVSLTKASAGDLSALRAMAGWYAVEMSRYYEPGVKPPRFVADDWLNRADPGCFIIRQGGEVAGFAVIAIRPAIPGVQENYFGEFYVKPEFRKGATAMQAASQMVRAYPGEWTADVLMNNKVSRNWVDAMLRRLDICGWQMRVISTPWGCATRYRFVVGG